ncbi:bifunctional diaminohydroxyphosphoribosylaminopyrimidine deaminase/5-amino-6-(5-phosphoribosylamino)uracil reductase RibD [Cellulophaga baltica]|uniref:bifunctional diaminohydroxyphosphoribosylaminopyrimidine deaminase/5-amino-6-(5-phosphoribosylamino)uracil reductase RibD n=1 Tax=Cellulophaga TaxID=104264 RepID=UPI001C0785F1|nr:bifunctional diaminohydroxyphosphoribosylaminopyrimidine deaminase/5-amino-6-(5-phosphoribosylamino)uracil reductase RibD [Cellulophaga sp. 1_MG-2023]MBU2996019.1 bifunctional diaminohydroxyphosphoribosylaminopyrimidine deaminase/5-amino-6-(5-phosphoribosylamino)uracil reductase RibD [Cellulophaga baltica]MDO6767414.1 bifunctional diaminohydroxyphosphoribosylaminopyrimidine deaminase/5-amino-6-(5-phosphoribosylamino)uracil reductase RibD [Cellulophaga sp. 1_MG-2023]
MKIHEFYILRCIEIAQSGLGDTAPNPMVGAVIVLENKIIGEGYTSEYGGPHAEVNAINSVADKSLLVNATIYVTLEPCSHYGKTPPCADLIIKHKIKNVVIGLLDPHEKVAGQGIKRLKDAGCNVTVGVLEKECRTHHKRFLTFQEKNRPYIILKWAATANGFIAPDKSLRAREKQPFWITNSYSKQLVHQWRAEEQAILVGTNTVLEDNPKLDVRNWTGKNPTRIILDRTLKIDTSHHVRDKSIKTIIFTEIPDILKHDNGNDYILIDFSKNIASQICEALHKQNIQSVIIEGGLQTLQTFIDENLWDEARVFTGVSTFKKGTKAPLITGELKETKNIDTDILKIYYND